MRYFREPRKISVQNNTVRTVLCVKIHERAKCIERLRFYQTIEINAFQICMPVSLCVDLHIAGLPMSLEKGFE